MITKIKGKKIDFHQLINHSITPTLLINDEIIIYANKACLQLLKIENIDEILGQPYTKFLASEFHEFGRRRMNQVLKVRRTLKPAEVKILDANGKIIEAETVVGLYFFERDTYIQVAIQDITERKESQKILMQSEKLSIMGELATGIVHEVRNPLTILKGFLGLINDETDQNHTYISIMTDELKRIEKIANDLLYFSKPHEQNLKPTNVIKLIQDIVFLLDSFAFKKRICLNFDPDDKNIDIQCDEVQFKQAIINLIKNAIEATPYYGNVSLAIKKDKYRIAISVSDTGCGMTQEQVSKLGTSFYTTKEDGTGLGLMVTYNIIKNHHGKMNVKSEVGQGTTFTIELPNNF